MVPERGLVFCSRNDEAKKSDDCVLLFQKGADYLIAPEFTEALDDPEFRRQVLEVVDFGISRNQRHYSDKYLDASYVLYGKYSIEDVAKLLEWSKDPVPLNIGGYKYDEETNTFPVFFNYENDPDINDETKYEDRFVSRSELIAISKHPRRMDSNDIQVIRNSVQNGTRIYLFMRKNKNDSGANEFYFLGEMYPTGEFKAIKVGDADAVEITYRLQTPVRADLYDYMTTNLGSEEP